MLLNESHYPTLRYVKVIAAGAARQQLCIRSCSWIHSTCRHVSISPTFYARLFCAKVWMKVWFEPFFYLHFKFELFLAQEYWRKCSHTMLVKLTTGLAISKIWRSFLVCYIKTSDWCLLWTSCPLRQTFPNYKQIFKLKMDLSLICLTLILGIGIVALFSKYKRRKKYLESLGFPFVSPCKV